MGVAKAARQPHFNVCLIETMNSKPVAIVLVVLCILLGASLYYRHQKAVHQAEADAAAIRQLSKQVVDTSGNLKEQLQVNSQLETNLINVSEELGKISNNLINVSNTLVRTEAEAKAAAAASAAEVAKRDARINELESQKDDLTKKMTDLNGSITNLEGKIADTQRKLSASEGDRTFLLKELKRMQSEKSELERQFNDLAVLREQVKKLKDDLAISRRLDWIRKGLYGEFKGAERMQKGLTTLTNVGKTNFDLNVELKQDGSVKVNTNAPAAPK